MQKLLYAIVLFSSIAWSIGCAKDANSDVPPPDNNDTNNIPVPTNGRLSYGDTLFFLRNQPFSYNIFPVSKPAAVGYFKANPIGLALDSVTGRINISQSEAGLRYKVFYLDPTGLPLDSVKIVISGIDYKDSIFRIPATVIAYDTSFPIYNARPELVLPCGDDDEDNDGDLDDDDNQCVFDETDLDGDGDDDIDGVNQEKLLVDIKKGFIDVEASFRAGVFGSNPLNGDTRDFTFYYRLSDPSNLALNKITVRLYHFNTMADIPQWLLDEINSRKNTSNAVNSRTNQQLGLSGNPNRITYFAPKPKRPPLIIIVSQ